jgi:hypothetical protein
MARPTVISVEDKFRLICSVVSGGMSVAEAARRRLRAAWAAGLALLGSAR